MNDPRYASGTSLDRTNKEEDIDSLEGMLGDFSDGLFIGLKRLTIPQLDELRKRVKEVVDESRRLQVRVQQLERHDN
jgi:hypothetical protein